MAEIIYDNGGIIVKTSQESTFITLKNLTMDSRKALVEAVKYLNVE